jgi:hypothetical protein
MINDDCTTYNKLLYSDSHKDIVDDISYDTLYDAYTSETFKDNVCKITFNDKADEQQRKQYVKFVSDNDPKVINMKAKISFESVQNNVLDKNIIDKQNNVIVPLEKELSLKQQKIQQQNDVVQNRIEQKNVLDREIAQLENKLREIDRTYYNRNWNSYVLACEMPNLEQINRIFPGIMNKCGKFHIGSYNMDAMSAQGIANDSMRSISVPENLMVTLYNADNLKGKSKTYIGPIRINDLKNEYWENTRETIHSNKKGNNVSSLKVEPVKINLNKL